MSLSTESESESASSKLLDYLNRKFSGSSLQFAVVSDKTLKIEAADDIVLSVDIDSKNKTLEFSLFSPKLDRPVMFEEIEGVDFLDVRIDDELKSPDHEAEQEDIALAIDMLRIWAKENNYSISHDRKP